MSMIYNCWVLLGRRSAARCGSARYSTLTSSDSSSVGRASTASPTHSRRPARGTSTTDTFLLLSSDRSSTSRSSWPVMDERAAKGLDATSGGRLSLAGARPYLLSRGGLAPQPARLTTLPGSPGTPNPSRIGSQTRQGTILSACSPAERRGSGRSAESPRQGGSLGVRVRPSLWAATAASARLATPSLARMLET